MSKSYVLGTALLASIAVHANASIMTLQTGYSTAGSQASANAYLNTVNTALVNQARNNTKGYGSTTLTSYGAVSNSALFGANSDIAWKATIDFSVSAAQAGAWSFQTGVDFDYGGALFLDGVALAWSPNNMYWAGSYANTAQILRSNATLAAGAHTLTIYGLEHCCDGAQQAQFKIGSGQFTTFAYTDGLNPAAVPEPGTLATFGLGLAALVGLRRRTRA